MRSLDLPAGSILITPNQIPDSVYVLRKGLLGIFDKIDRIMAFIYREEAFGFEALFGANSMMTVKSLLPVEVDLYEPDEYRERLNENLRLADLKTMAWRIRSVKRRYNLTGEERMRDIIRELLDRDIDKNEIASAALNFSVADAIAFERVRGEFWI